MMKKIIALVTSGMALLSAVAIAADGKPLKTGDAAPDFTLRDAKGKKHKLSKQLKKTRVALLFYRSGDW